MIGEGTAKEWTGGGLSTERLGKEQPPVGAGLVNIR